jgi:predicted aspartyl protease
MVWGRALPIAIIVSLLVSDTSVRSDDGADGVPFELGQQHLVVTKGAIGPLTGLNLLIDTGTIPSMVDRRIAQKLHLRTESATLVAFGREIPIRSAVLDGLHLGPVQQERVPAGVGDLSYLEGVRIDAIVGLDVLVRTSFAVDYLHRTLTFTPAGQEDSVARMQVSWPFLTVQMTIAGEQVRLLIDTGTSDLVLFRGRMPAALADMPWRGDKTVRYASGPARLRRLDLHDVRLGTGEWRKLTAWVLDRELHGYPPEIQGILGVLALGCGRVQFDFQQNEFGCTPRTN